LWILVVVRNLLHYKTHTYQQSTIDVRLAREDELPTTQQHHQSCNYTKSKTDSESIVDNNNNNNNNNNNTNFLNLRFSSWNVELQRWTLRSFTQRRHMSHLQHKNNNHQIKSK
jgi:hypothetical protein